MDEATGQIQTSQDSVRVKPVLRWLAFLLAGISAVPLARAQVTMPDAIHVAPGFKIDLVYTAKPGQGSWASMTLDPKGRLLIGSQDISNIIRFTVTDGKLVETKTLPGNSVADVQGLLVLDHSLYLSGNGPGGFGLYHENYRDAGLGAPELLHAMGVWPSDEHGVHGIVLGPDGKIYMVCGNETAVPADLGKDSPFAGDADDQLLPSAMNPYDNWEQKLKPPHGFVLRMNRDGKNCQLFAGGLRNVYDIDFNSDGELFGFDNDSEPDIGLSWYRPTHLIHLVSGGEYGWREGTAVMPYYDEDGLPGADVGLGAPTGVKFAPANCNFPASYRDACFVEDWAYGRIMAIHLTPHGADYDATVETVLRGVPLNLTALRFGRDGNLYFITGGRSTQSALYRLSYVGPQVEEAPKTKAQQMAEAQAKTARQLRHKLESCQGKCDPRLVDVIWPSLGSDDRWIRYAARVALEFQKVEWWEQRALSETDKNGGLTALLALARCGGPDTQNDLFASLRNFQGYDLNQDQKHLALRVMELSFIRQGPPGPELSNGVVNALAPFYPSGNTELDHELCQILLYLNAPGAVSNTVALLEKAPTGQEQIYYAMRLRTIHDGWTADARRKYLTWFNYPASHAPPDPVLVRYFKDVGLDYTPGQRYANHLAGFRHEAMAILSPNGEEELPGKPAGLAGLPQHPSIKKWQMSDFLPVLDQLNSGRSFAHGKAEFTEAGCILCHKFGSGGGSVGPELTAVYSRSSPRDILESILEPSKVVPGQYQNTRLTLKSGDTIVGRLVGENAGSLTLMTDLLQSNKVEVRRADIDNRRLSKISPMPEGLVDWMTRDQILDLIAYLESGGKADAPMFK
jgi:putative heme-binding domain-containing protein